MATLDYMNRNAIRELKAANKIRIIGVMGRIQAGKSVFINEFRQENQAGRFVEGGGRTTVVESGSLYCRDINHQYCFVEIPSFQNQPPHDGDGAIIHEIANYLVQVYESHGFAGLVYLHDVNESITTAVQRDIALFCAMIGQELYDHTVLVLNKYEDELIQLPPRLQDIQDIQNYWRELTADNRAVIMENGKPRGNPRPIVELIWDKQLNAFALAKELKTRNTKLHKTSVGKVYQEFLKKEIKRKDTPPARRVELKKELKKWKKI